MRDMSSVISLAPRVRFWSDATQPGGAGASGKPTSAPGWVIVCSAQIRPFSYAYAVAAEREARRSLPRMLLTCRAAVFSLRNSSVAIARFVRPVAHWIPTARSCYRGPARRTGADRHRSPINDGACSTVIRPPDTTPTTTLDAGRAVRPDRAERVDPLCDRPMAALE